MAHVITVKLHVCPSHTPWAPGSWHWEATVSIEGQAKNTERTREQAIAAAEAFVRDLDRGPAVIVRHYLEPTP